MESYNDKLDEQASPRYLKEGPIPTSDTRISDKL